MNENSVLAALLTSFLGTPAALAVANTQGIYFAIGEFASERSVPIAILTTVKFDGVPCPVQIDTGLNAAVRWHTIQPVASNEWIEVELGNLRHSAPASSEVRSLIKACGTGAPIASLGNGFFDTGTLEINFRTLKLTYSHGSALDADLNSGRFRYAKWGTDGGQVLVQTSVPRNLPREALLDSGSLRADLVVHDRVSWQTLTKNSRSNPVNFLVWAWGRQHQCVSQASSVPIELQEGQQFSPVVTYCPTLKFQPVEPVLGTIGMRRYLNGSVTIDYPAQRWRATTGLAQ